MRALLQFLKNNSAFFLFLFLEGLALFFIIKFNSFQHNYVFNSANKVVGNVYQWTGTFSDYFRLRSINSELATENAQLRTTVATLENKLQGNHSDTTHIYTSGINPEMENSYIPAKVVNASINRFQNYITINKGTDSGVFPDMGVISSTGVVGVVSSSSRHFSVVIPVINSKIKISSKIKKNDYVGALYWDGVDYQYGYLEDIPLHVNVARGDTLITSGFSSIFPEGILTGVVDEVLLQEGNPFLEIKVKLAVNFQSISFVYIVKNRYKEEQESLERRDL